MLSEQLIVELGTAIITILTAPLAVYITLKYFKGKQKPYLYWSIGMWAFAVAALEEVIFSTGIYSQLLISSYLLIVAMVVLFLSLGSVELLKSQKIKTYYGYFAILATIFMIYALATTPNEGNLLEGYVVEGLPSLIVITASSIITFPAAAALIIIAAKSYLKKRSRKPLSIILGVITVSVAGTLYIVSFPVFLYFSEFFGILLLWLGLV